MLSRFFAVKEQTSTGVKKIKISKKELLFTALLSFYACFLLTSNLLVNSNNEIAEIRYEITPAFINHYMVKNQLRELRVHVELVSNDKKTMRLAEKNIAEIRNKLSTLFASQDFLSLMNVEGKEALRAAALTEVQAVLQKEFDEQRLDTVLFLSFVAS